MSKYKIGRRNLEKENKWENIDINNFKIDRPTVICFGGRGTIQPRHANYLCRLAKSLVGLVEEGKESDKKEVDFVGIIHDPFYSAFQLARGADATLSHSDEKEIAFKLLISMCIDEEGRLLKNSEIIKNFNRLTFFTHCQGASEAKEVVNFAKQEMKGLGLSKECIASAIGQIFAVNYAPIANCGIPSLNVFSLKDLTLNEHISNPDEKDAPSVRFFSLAKNQIDEYGNVIIKDNAQTATLVCSNMSYEHQEESLEHRITFLDRDENWQSRVWDISRQGDKTSQIVGYALATSIASGIKNINSRSFEPKPTIDQLIEDTKSIMKDTENLQFNKIVGDIMGENENNLPTNLEMT